MTIYGVRRRVACYVTRQGAHGLELLVFDHSDDDPDDPSGTQVPSGGRLGFATLTDDAVREVREETGLDVTFVRSLGAVELGLGKTGGPSVTDYVQLAGPEGTPSAWRHTVSGGGEDNGMVFVCRWEPLPLAVELADGQEAFLSELPPE